MVFYGTKKCNKNVQYLRQKLYCIAEECANMLWVLRAVWAKNLLLAQYPLALAKIIIMHCN